MVDGSLVLAAERGEPDGPRAIDPAARLVRFADPGRDIPFHELRAVAAIVAARTTPSLDTNQTARKMHPTFRPALVLVPRRLPGEVAAWLDALESGQPPGAGFSVRGAAAQVDQVSVPFYDPHTPLESRRTAKAIARLAGLPMLELYGEFPVWRPAGGLDLSLLERLGRSATIPAAGPPPVGVELALEEGRLRLDVAPRERDRWPWFVGAGVLAVAAVPLLMGPIAMGAVVLSLAGITLAFALHNKPPPGSSLRVSRGSVSWSCGDVSESFTTDELEMMRVADDGTLVLVRRDDETRCPCVTAQRAAWMRAAIEEYLARPDEGRILEVPR